MMIACVNRGLMPLPPNCADLDMESSYHFNVRHHPTSSHPRARHQAFNCPPPDLGSRSPSEAKIQGQGATKKSCSLGKAKTARPQARGWPALKN